MPGPRLYFITNRPAPSNPWSNRHSTSDDGRMCDRVRVAVLQGCVNVCAQTEARNFFPSSKKKADTHANGEELRSGRLFLLAYDIQHDRNQYLTIRLILARSSYPSKACFNSLSTDARNCSAMVRGVPFAKQQRVSFAMRLRLPAELCALIRQRHFNGFPGFQRMAKEALGDLPSSDLAGRQVHACLMKILFDISLLLQRL